MVKKNVDRLRYWTGPMKSTRKGRNFKKSPKKFGPKREPTQKDEFLLKFYDENSSWLNKC